MMDLEAKLWLARFNFIEAMIWLSISLVFISSLIYRIDPPNRMRLAAGALFGAFGWTDLIEVRTGAWWNPPALMWSKGICILGFMALYIWFRQRPTALAPISDRRDGARDLQPKGGEAKTIDI